METYPRTIIELEQWFNTEAKCREYIGKLRWEDGFRCPKCGHRDAWLTDRGLYHCRSCEHQTSITAGTIFEGTRKPLRMWFRAIWHVTNEKNGVSAVGLQRALGLKSYQTAWTWLHKLRRAMVRPGRERLSGTVEVDETFVGGIEHGVRGRLTETKAIVAIAAEYDENRIGRIRLRQLPDTSGNSVIRFIRECVDPGSLIVTDGWSAYKQLPEHGYPHEVKILRGRGRSAPTDMLPRVHRVAALLKRWLLGTHQGSVGYQHLDYYLDEFTFRFNRRTSKSRGLLFYRLMQQAVQVEAVPYKDLVGGTNPAGGVSSRDH